MKRKIFIAFYLLALLVLLISFKSKGQSVIIATIGVNSNPGFSANVDVGQKFPVKEGNTSFMLAGTTTLSLKKVLPTMGVYGGINLGEQSTSGYGLSIYGGGNYFPLYIEDKDCTTYTLQPLLGMRLNYDGCVLAELRWLGKEFFTLTFGWTIKL